MKIDILRLIPKNWTVENLQDKIKVYYIVKKNHKYANPKPVTFPKVIDVDENLISGLALYLGDGSFQKNKQHACFANKDKDICRFMWDFFHKRFELSINDISCFLCYRHENQNILRDWSAALQIPKTKFKIRYSNRHRCETLTLQINRTIFRQVFEALTKEVIKSNFLKDKNLRRAFLRGLFAAEGCVGIAKDSPKPYINDISFSLSYYEDELVSLVTNALSLEHIKYKIVKDITDHSAQICIFGWDNYWKLWDCKIFDLCERKKSRFLNIAKALEVNCVLSDDLRDNIFDKTGLTQRELAKHLDSWQGNVCKMTKGELGVSVDRLLKLSELGSTSLRHIKNNVKSVLVGRLTPINDQNFINFIFDLKTSLTNLYS